MATIDRTAQAARRGMGEGGTGRLTTRGGVLKDVRHGFQTRFADGPGPTRKNLSPPRAPAAPIIALAFQLQGAGHTPESFDAEARVSMEQEGGGWTVKAVELSLWATVPGCGPEEFHELAEAAKANCPVSRVLKADGTLSAELG